MYDVAESMADAVYHQRTRLGLSQKELAERAHVSRHTIVNIESGQAAGIRMSTLFKVFDALGRDAPFSKASNPSPCRRGCAHTARAVPQAIHCWG